ncbi:PREDICTED: cbp/p300-interacting transactivator 1-like [Calidris pugnax]|uniref:cbp/p300-interacting transactivator 1-like n=1 Tax=Calidris pugnax TaxID=198806 RepID=UPI00071DA8D1|nr:PREDICTED: cbp/p300-interacting transactivator 1-like [Calidris pugnax]
MGRKPRDPAWKGGTRGFGLGQVSPPGNQGPRGGGDLALPRRYRGRQTAGLRGGGLRWPPSPPGLCGRVPTSWSVCTSRNASGRGGGGSGGPRARLATQPWLGDAAVGRGESAAGTGIVDSDPLYEAVLRTLVLELGLDAADELPELWLGQHEFDLPADLPAVC